MAPLTPEVTWAQRSSETTASKNIVYLTIVAPDVSSSAAKIDLQPTYVEFSGPSTSKKADYHVKLEFFAEIDTEESKINHTARDIEFVLRKKEQKEEYWPRLTKEKARLHFLKTDFDKWVDEDEQDAVADEDLSGAGGLGGMGGMPGMPGMDGLGGGDFGGIDFSKLGAGGGLGGLGGLGGDLGDMGGEGEDSDDDDMPDLEGEDKTEATEKAGEASTAGASAEASSSSKIEEVN